MWCCNAFACQYLLLAQQKNVAEDEMHHFIEKLVALASVCVHTRVCVHMYVRVCLCVCVCVYVCAWVCHSL